MDELVEEVEPVEETASRRRWWLLALGAAAFVAIGVYAATTIGPAANTAGHGEAPAFTLDNLHEGEAAVSLADYRGKPLVVNFFASWCVPCIQEMPAFEKVHQQLGDRVAFVGINHSDDRPAALELVRNTGVSYPAGFDPQGNVAVSFGLIGMPTTVFIAPDGRVLEQHTGVVSEDQLRSTIERLFPA